MKGKESSAQTDPGTVNLQFKVWAPGFNRVNHRLFLLGSLKQMGAWNINQAVEAFPTSDLHVWKAEVKGVPPKVTFEWVWLKTRSDRSQIQWERSIKRNRTIDNYSGIIHSIFGEGQEVFQQTATCVELSTFIKLEDGQVLVLTGDSISTGSWDLTRSVKAKEYPRQSGYWRAHVSFDASTSLNFKWAVIREKDRKLQVMEKYSHCLYGRPSMLRVVAPWNLPRVFVVDTNISVDPLDSMAGRTDLIIGDRKKRLEEIRTWLKKANTGKTPSLVPLSQVPTPTQPKSSPTPSTTDIELAKAAILQMSHKAIPLLSQQPAARTPTVKPVVNIEEHSKQRQDRLTRIQKLVRQFNEEYKGSGTVSHIKGKGQNDAAKESGELCDWSHDFPWSCQNATADEAKCLGLKSDTEPSKVISGQAFRVAGNGSKDKSDVVSCVPGDNVRIPQGNKKDEDEHHEDEDSGLESMSHSVNISQTVESTSSLMEELHLGYDLVPVGFSEIAQNSDKGFGVKGSQEEPLSAASSSSCIASGVETPTHLKGYKIEAEKFQPCFPVDGHCVVKEETEATIANSIMETLGLINSRDVEKENGYLDWLSRKIERELKYCQKAKQIKDGLDTFDNPEIGSEGELQRDKREEYFVCIDRQNDLSGNSISVNPVFVGNEAPFIDTEMIGCFEHSELVQRRKMAQILEEQWGSQGFSSFKTMLQSLPSASPVVVGHPHVLTHLTGSGDLVGVQRIDKMADYPDVELLASVQAAPQDVDHRAVARMLEKRWGMMAYAVEAETRRSQ